MIHAGSYTDMTFSRLLEWIAGLVLVPVLLVVLFIMHGGK